MKRPTINDVETLHAVAKRFVPRMRQWLNGDMADESDSVLEADIARALRGSFDLDAYSIAREFEKMTYCVNSALVQLFEAASLLALDETQKRVRAWVIANGILPAFAVGDKVTVSPHDGTIIRVDAETAEYVVQCPSVGHSGSAGYVVGFEIVRAK